MSQPPPPPPPQGPSGAPAGSPLVGPSYPPGPVVGLPRSPGIAIAAMACGIAGIPLFFLLVPSVLGIVFGFVAESKIRRQPGGFGVGRGLARTGWITGIVGALAFAVFAWAVATDRIETDDEVSVFSLDVGDCVDLGAAPSSPEEQVEEFPSATATNRTTARSTPSTT